MKFSFFAGPFPLIITLFSCSQTEMERQFAMEKAIDRANRQKQQFYLTAGGLDSGEFDILSRQYSDIAAMVEPPPDDSASIRSAPLPLLTSWQMAGLAFYNLGLLNMEQEKYDEAFGNFEHLIGHYGFKPHQVQTAMLMQALARYKQNRYREAVMLYNAVSLYYIDIARPESDPNLDALDTPLTAARILRDAGDGKQFNIQLKRALDYYWGILSSHHGTPLGNAAVGKLASAFLLGDLADSAVTVLSEVKDPKTGEVPPLILYNIASIQREYLKDFAAAKRSYRKFVRSYPKHQLTATAQFGLAASLFAAGQYSQARDEAAKLETARATSENILSEAGFLKALSYQLENNWPRALGEFDFVKTNYPISRRGMETPLHIAEYYLSKGDSKLALESYGEAEKDYRRLLDVYSARRDIVPRAMSFLANSLSRQELWQEAAEILKQLASRFPETPEGYSAGPAAADILSHKLNRPSEAAAMLRLFANSYPGSKDVPAIISYADSLEARLR